MIQDIPIGIYIKENEFDCSSNALPLSIEIVPYKAFSMNDVIIETRQSNVDITDIIMYKCKGIIFCICSSSLIAMIICFLFFLSNSH